MRTRVKICGITELEYARAAVDAGVDALGFIFVSRSPRNIEPQKAREIISQLPPFVDAVCVFVNEEIQTVSEIVQFCGADYAQLHGSESPEFCQQLTCKVIKSLQVRNDMTADILAPYGGIVHGFLLDTFHKDVAGGTGETFDWQLVEKVNPPGPFILAGGLGPENISEAISQVHPFAVDVNSGVESAPGIKDADKILRLMEEIK